jgi:membrane fusion protein (multidrug efflux system)
MSNQNDSGTVATAPAPAPAAAAPGEATNTGEPLEAKKRRFKPIILICVVVVLAVAGVLYYLYTQTYQDTDDAQVDGHLNPIASRVDGTVTAVYVEDNSMVKAGDPLVDLDPADSKVAFAQAQAQYDQAMAQVTAAHPNVPITRTSNATDVSSQQAEVANADAALAAAQHDLDSDIAKLKQAQATNDRNQADFARYQILYDKKEVSKADYDQYRATAEAQQAAVASSEAEVSSARKIIDQRRAQLLSQQAKLRQTQQNGPLQLQIREADIKTSQANAEVTRAQLEQAKLNLTYTHITAPIPGVVTQRSAEIGARVATGQQLMMIVQIDDLWVTANFKETQLARMHPGQKVHIHVDALKDDFDGVVESMPAATGSATSVLPPENATGNFVKVVQRLPVRIRFIKGQRDLDKLRPGMSVEPKVELN